MGKRLMQSAFMVLFTGILCVFIMTTTPVSEDITVSENIIDSEKNAMSIQLSSVDQEALEPEEESEAAQIAEALLEEVCLDKDFILSIVSSLPENDELFCTDLDILSSPQVKKVQSTVERFHKDSLNVSFIVLDLNTGSFFSLNPDSDYYSASAIKGPYVAALNKFSPEIVDEYAEFMMENTIRWSSNEDYENLHYLYGNDAMYDMTEYTDVSDSIIDEYNWYPYLTAKELTKLWIGIYVYFFDDTNENSSWCRSLYTDSTESFIHSALGGSYTVYTKPGWYSDWEDIARNDAGIVMADGHDYILTIMSDAFDSYEDLEYLAAALDDVHGLLCSSSDLPSTLAADPDLTAGP